MKQLIVFVGLALSVDISPAAAQNLIIANARILDGTGKVIERGTVVVRNGKIASVAAGNPGAAGGARVINARGMTVMPGFVDAHRHPIQGNAAEWLEKSAAAEMLSFLVLTKNAARSALKQDLVGTLEPGKLADIVIVDGDPLNDVDDLTKVVTTIKGGVVLVDKMTPAGRARR